MEGSSNKLFMQNDNLDLTIFNSSSELLPHPNASFQNAKDLKLKSNDFSHFLEGSGVWVKWKGSYQVGVVSDLKYCRLSDIKSKPTYADKEYYFIYFLCNSTFKWIDSSNILSIDDTPEPLAFGSLEWGRKIATFSEFSKKFSILNLVGDVCDLGDRLHLKSVVEYAQILPFWENFMSRAVNVNEISEVGKFLLELYELIIQKYINSYFVKKRSFEWKIECMNASSVFVVEKLIKELTNAILWKEIQKLWISPEQPQISPEWFVWKNPLQQALKELSFEEECKLYLDENQKKTYSNQNMKRKQSLKYSTRSTNHSSYPSSLSNDANIYISSSLSFNSDYSLDFDLNSEGKVENDPWMVGNRMHEEGRSVENGEEMKGKEDYHPFMKEGEEDEGEEGKDGNRHCIKILSSGKWCGKKVDYGNMYCCMHNENSKQKEMVVEKSTKMDYLFNRPSTSLSSDTMCMGWKCKGRKCSNFHQTHSMFCKEHEWQEMVFTHDDVDSSDAPSAATSSSNLLHMSPKSTDENLKIGFENTSFNVSYNGICIATNMSRDRKKCVRKCAHGTMFCPVHLRFIKNKKVINENENADKVIVIETDEGWEREEKEEMKIGEGAREGEEEKVKGLEEEMEKGEEKEVEKGEENEEDENVTELELEEEMEKGEEKETEKGEEKETEKGEEKEMEKGKKKEVEKVEENEKEEEEEEKNDEKGKIKDDGLQLDAIKFNAMEGEMNNEMNDEMKDEMDKNHDFIFNNVKHNREDEKKQVENMNQGWNDDICTAICVSNNKRCNLKKGNDSIYCKKHHYFLLSKPSTQKKSSLNGLSKSFLLNKNVMHPSFPSFSPPPPSTPSYHRPSTSQVVKKKEMVPKTKEEDFINFLNQISENCFPKKSKNIIQDEERGEKEENEGKEEEGKVVGDHNGDEEEEMFNFSKAKSILIDFRQSFLNGFESKKEEERREVRTKPVSNSWLFRSQLLDTIVSSTSQNPKLTKWLFVLVSEVLNHLLPYVESAESVAKLKGWKEVKEKKQEGEGEGEGEGEREGEREGEGGMGGDRNINADDHEPSFWFNLMKAKEEEEKRGKRKEEDVNYNVNALEVGICNDDMNIHLQSTSKSNHHHYHHHNNDSHHLEMNKCEICGKCFGNNSNLLRHFALAHKKHIKNHSPSPSPLLSTPFPSAPFSPASSPSPPPLSFTSDPALMDKEKKIEKKIEYKGRGKFKRECKCRICGETFYALPDLGRHFRFYHPDEIHKKSTGKKKQKQKQRKRKGYWNEIGRASRPRLEAGSMEVEMNEEGEEGIMKGMDDYREELMEREEQNERKYNVVDVIEKDRVNVFVNFITDEEKDVYLSNFLCLGKDVDVVIKDKDGNFKTVRKIKREERGEYGEMDKKEIDQQDASILETVDIHHHGIDNHDKVFVRVNDVDLSAFDFESQENQNQNQRQTFPINIDLNKNQIPSQLQSQSQTLPAGDGQSQSQSLNQIQTQRQIFPTNSDLNKNQISSQLKNRSQTLPVVDDISQSQNQIFSISDDLLVFNEQVVHDYSVNKSKRIKLHVSRSNAHKCTEKEEIEDSVEVDIGGFQILNNVNKSFENEMMESSIMRERMIQKEETPTNHFSNDSIDPNSIITNSTVENITNTDNVDYFSNFNVKPSIFASNPTLDMLINTDNDNDINSFSHSVSESLLNDDVDIPTAIDIVNHLPTFNTVNNIVTDTHNNTVTHTDNDIITDNVSDTATATNTITATATTTVTVTDTVINTNTNIDTSMNSYINIVNDISINTDITNVINTGTNPIIDIPSHINAHTSSSIIKDDVNVTDNATDFDTTAIIIPHEIIEGKERVDMHISHVMVKEDNRLKQPFSTNHLSSKVNSSETDNSINVSVKIIPLDQLRPWNELMAKRCSQKRTKTAKTTSNSTHHSSPLLKVLSRQKALDLNSDVSEKDKINLDFAFLEDGGKKDKDIKMLWLKSKMKDGKIIICDDVSFGKESVAIPCVIDEDVLRQISTIDFMCVVKEERNELNEGEDGKQQNIEETFMDEKEKKVEERRAIENVSKTLVDKEEEEREVMMNVEKINYDIPNAYSFENQIKKKNEWNEHGKTENDFGEGRKLKDNESNVDGEVFLSIEELFLANDETNNQKNENIFVENVEKHAYDQDKKLEMEKRNEEKEMSMEYGKEKEEKDREQEGRRRKGKENVMGMEIVMAKEEEEEEEEEKEKKKKKMMVIQPDFLSSTFHYITKRKLHSSLGFDAYHSQIGCQCLNDQCNPILCTHVLMFYEDNPTAVDLFGKSMVNRFPYDENERIVLQENYLVYECNAQCHCNQNCHNRVLQRGVKVKLEIFRTKNKGWAVRAVENIFRGTFICEYVGEVVDDDEANIRGQKYDKVGRSYLYDIDAHIDRKDKSQKVKPFVIDATCYGNVARFINHSCNPNLMNYQVLIESMDYQLAHIGLFASRDIMKGEELAYDYRYQLLSGKGCSCHCGAFNCRGRLY